MHSHKRSHGSRNIYRGRPYTPPSTESSNSNDSFEGSSSSSHRKKRKRYSKDNLHGEVRKDKPTTLDGEVKYGKEVEVWLLGMRKYFQAQGY